MICIIRPHKDYTQNRYDNMVKICVFPTYLSIFLAPKYHTIVDDQIWWIGHCAKIISYELVQMVKLLFAYGKLFLDKHGIHQFHCLTWNESRVGSSERGKSTMDENKIPYYYINPKIHEASFSVNCIYIPCNQAHSDEKQSIPLVFCIRELFSSFCTCSTQYFSVILAAGCTSTVPSLTISLPLITTITASRTAFLTCQKIQYFPLNNLHYATYSPQLTSTDVIQQ